MSYHNCPTDYTRRAEHSALNKKVDELAKALDRTLAILERQQALLGELADKYQALCDELDHSYEGMDEDITHLADAIEAVAEAAGVPCPLQRIPDDERYREEDEEPAALDERAELFETPPKKVLH